MKKNISGTDRVLRILVSVVLIVLYGMHIVSGTWGIVLVAAAVIFTLTAFMNFCPIYFVLGIKKWQSK